LLFDFPFRWAARDCLSDVGSAASSAFAIPCFLPGFMPLIEAHDPLQM
jgi:hypothetical protein